MAMHEVTEEVVKELVEEGWSEQEIRRGYSVFTSDCGNGALHIERLDIVGRFDTDEEAAEQAEKDGHSIIRNVKFNDPEDEAFYLDTPANRELLKGLYTEL